MYMRIFAIFLLAVCSTATNAAAQNAVPCLKPWTIPDKWIDRHDDSNNDMWTTDDTFETVDSHGNALSVQDEYIAPSAGSPGSGFTIPTDLGQLLTLKIGDPQDAMKSGWLYAIDIGTAGGGGNAYRTAIATCQDTPVFIGDRVLPLSGNLHGPTVQGVADLINLDPDAVWNPVTSSVQNSCAPSPSCGSVSPRIVPIAVFNPAVFEASLINSGQPELVITNVIGVFIDGVVGGKVTGYIVALPTPNIPEP
jgi:hypothetical protein